MLREITQSFSVGIPVLGDSFVDRASILAHSEDLFSAGAGNILIVGERRAGKTSLCHKLQEAASGMKGRMATYMSAEPSFDRPAQFTQAVLLHIIRAIASSLFAKSYSQLLHDLPRRNKLRTDYAKLLRIFELARRSAGVASMSLQKEVGVVALAQAKLIEVERTDSTVSQLSSTENLLLLEELAALLRDHSVSRFILFVDEANKLTLEENSLIIRENLALFSSRGVQFCFVTTPEVVAAVPASHELFQRTIEVGPFEDIGALRTLIERNCRRFRHKIECDDVFSPSASDAIWRLSKGLPFRIQQLCLRSLERAQKTLQERVELEDVLDSVPSAELS